MLDIGVLVPTPVCAEFRGQITDQRRMLFLAEQVVEFLRILLEIDQPGLVRAGVHEFVARSHGAQPK